MLSGVGLTPAHAVTFGFTNISNNSGVAAQVGSQLSVDVTAQGTSEVRFTFTNSGPIASSITDIYFVDTSLLFTAGQAVGVVNSPGVNFADGASPQNLPGGNTVSFGASSFAADSEPPAQPNGVNPGETLALILALAGPHTVADVVSGLLLNSFKIGLHVQGILPPGSNRDFSDAFVTTTPIPAALPLFVTGLASLGFFQWRKKRSLVVGA